MAKTYVAARPIAVGSDEVEKDEDGNERNVVHHYEEGEVVAGAEGFDNLDALVANGYLREKAGTEGRAKSEAKATTRKAARKATRAASRRKPRT
jgi:hypothetical protein